MGKSFPPTLKGAVVSEGQLHPLENILFLHYPGRGTTCSVKEFHPTTAASNTTLKAVCHSHCCLEQPEIHSQFSCNTSLSPFILPTPSCCQISVSVVTPFLYVTAVCPKCQQKKSTKTMKYVDPQVDINGNYSLIHQHTGAG